MKRLFKVGSAIVLGLSSMGLCAENIDQKFYSTVQENRGNDILQISTGILNLDHINKKESFIELKYAKIFGENGELTRDLILASSAKIKFSKSLKDFELNNYIVPLGISQVSNKKYFVACNTGIGWIMVNSIKQVESKASDPNAAVSISNEIEKQNAPYISFEWSAGYFIENNILLTGALKYKYAVDKVDVRDGYNGKIGVSYKNWNLIYEYEKLDLRDVNDVASSSFKVGYFFTF